MVVQCQKSSMWNLHRQQHCLNEVSSQHPFSSGVSDITI
jgi:hypothetical protein